jgi:hypothetical protein
MCPDRLNRHSPAELGTRQTNRADWPMHFDATAFVRLDAPQSLGTSASGACVRHVDRRC